MIFNEIVQKMKIRIKDKKDAGKKLVRTGENHGKTDGVAEK